MKEMVLVLIYLNSIKETKNDVKLHSLGLLESLFKTGMWKRKHFEERSWKRKQTRKHLTFLRNRKHFS